jgi:hypothetical protein
VKIVCPNCNFSKEIPEERIPPGVKWVTCPQCKNRFQFREAVPVVDPSTVLKLPFAEAQGSRRADSGPTERENGAKRHGILSPWERRSDIGFWRGASQTLKAVLFSPTEFFKNTAVDGGVKEPLAFGLLTGSLGMMFEVFWQFLFMGENFGIFTDTLFGPYAMTGAFLGIMAFCPFFILFAILLTSVITHVLLMVVGGGGNGFEATFRVSSLCQAAQVWGVIPFIGGWIGAFWFFVAQVIGLKEIHDTSYLRVALALMIPLFFILLLLVMAVALGLL